MVLHYNEYVEYANTFNDLQSQKFRRVKAFIPEKKYLHEMTGNEIISFISTSGIRSMYALRHAVIYYLTWLQKEYDIDTTDLIYKVKTTQINADYIGVLDTIDLCETVDEAMYMVQCNKIKINTYLATAVYYLEWYGVKPEDMLSIMLTDVHNEGKEIYVPAMQKTIFIDNSTIANFLWEYAHTDVIVNKNKICLKGNTLLRTKSDIKLLAVLRVYSYIDDPRLKSGVVFNSGACYRLYQIEQEQHFPISITKNIEQIAKEFGCSELSTAESRLRFNLYKVYKRAYIKYLQDKNS